MDSVRITRHADFGAGEYQAHVPGSTRVGRLSWVERNGARVAEHTVVPPELGGKGVATQLVEALMQDAREEGFKVVPQCSFVAAAFHKHPEWGDLRA